MDKQKHTINRVLIILFASFIFINNSNYLVNYYSERMVTEGYARPLEGFVIVLTGLLLVLVFFGMRDKASMTIMFYILPSYFVASFIGTTIGIHVVGLISLVTIIYVLRTWLIKRDAK